MEGFYQLPAWEQQVWTAQYGAAAPYIWAQQSGAWAAPSAQAQGFNALPADQQAIWYGTYGEQAPQIWAQQAAAAGGAGAQGAQAGAAGSAPRGAGGQVPFVGYNQWGGTVAPSTPATIGAGTAGIQYGYGVPGFGQAQIPINPDYLSYLQSAPGYIPGSGTYNQFRLDQPGLLTNILGQQMNARYGQGGTGDPTTGQEPQTPQEWLNQPQLFTWDFNMGQTPDTQGLDYIANLFGRPESSSGLSTAAFSAPEQYWQGLYQNIANGKVKPTAAGWRFLAQYKGVTPQTVGGVAPQQAAAVGAGTGGAGGTGNAQTDALASIAASQAADQAARQAYQEWTMRTGDETLALQKAQQAWSQTFQERAQKFAQGVTEAGLLGTYNGQQTQAAQQQQWNQGFQQQQADRTTALSLLQQQSALQGPRDWLKYQQLNANTPQGFRDLVAGLAGQYGFAGSGAQGTPGAATLATRTQDLLSGGQAMAGAQAQNQYALPSPNQINLRNWTSMSPSQQQMALGAYESQGYPGDDVLKQLQAAAPRYVGPSAATVGM